MIPDIASQMSQAFAPNPFAAMMGAMGGGAAAAPQMNIADLISALRAPKVSAHLGMGGGQITPDNPMGNLGGDPFTNGMLNHSPAPTGPMNYMTGTPWAHMTPDQFGLMRSQPGTATPWTMPQQNLPGVSQGMINPRLPDAQKYQDGNFWSAMGSVNYPKPKPRPMATAQNPFGFIPNQPIPGL